MASDQSSTLDANVPADDVERNNQNMGRRLHGVVIFLLPCRRMSELRRTLLLPDIHAKGGVVTTDPSAATHCVIAIPMDSKSAMNLLSQYQVPAGCILVPDVFLYQ